MANKVTDMNLPWVESPFFKDILNSKNLHEEDKKIAIEYNENGFVVIPGLFTDSVIEEVKADMNNKGFNPDFEVKTFRNEVRIQDLWMYAESVKKMSSNPKILEILEMLYGREAIPFQSLNFRVGTQQRAHSDTIHFSSIPSKFMCGVWVALEDTTPENGAVFYYPKSHHLQEYNFSHFIENPIDASYNNYKDYEDFIENILAAGNFEKKPFYAKKGDVLIWSSNIIHGGSKVINEKSTRYSQVTHYYFKDCIYYTPMLSNMVTHELFLRNKVVNIKTGEKVKQSFNGNSITYFETAKNKFILNNRIRFRKLPKILKKLLFKM